MPDLDHQISSNRRRSGLLFVGFFLIYAVMAIGVSLWAGGWPAGNSFALIIIFFLIAGAIVVFTFTMGDDMAVMLAKAKQVEKSEQAPELWNAVEAMAIASGQPMPRVYISPDPSPNAFAAGRSKKQALVCVNQGLLDLLDKDELEAVVAHEMAHIRNMDVRLMTYAAVLAGGIALISEAIIYMTWFSGGGKGGAGGSIISMVIVLISALLAPLAAAMIQMSISRRREFLADASAVEMTKYPAALISALRRLEASHVTSTTGSKATAHLCIVAPLFGKGNASTLFSTHPPTEERIAALEALGAGSEHQRRQA